MEFLSHQHLLIAVAPMLAMGYLAAFVGLFIVWRDRRKSELAHRKASEANSASSPSEKPKAAHA
jgi:hypothetical protein